MRIVPLYANVLVRPVADGEISRGGLLIPSIAKQSSPFRYGDVIATGSGRVNAEGKIVPLAVKVGDVVMFDRKAGVEVPIETNGGEALMRIMGEQSILGVVHDLPQKTSLVGLDGRLISMEPMSRAITHAASKGAPADSVVRAREELDRAEKDFGIDTSDHVDEEAS